MLDKVNEQQISVEFLVKLKKTATEMFNFLREVFGKNTLSKRDRMFE
jgi:hypothetical protein